MKLFISYSHKDEALCKELQTHLVPLERNNIITQWYDREINGGEDFENSIKLNIAESDIILFLLSPDFLASKYINETEVKLAMEQHEIGKSVVVPIILRKCQFDLTPFKNIQGLPTDLEPVNSMKWVSKDDAFFDIVEGLKNIIRHQEKKKEILEDEETKWKVAKDVNTIDSYLKYLKNSRLRTKLDEVIFIVGKLNFEKFKLNKEQNTIELEIIDRERQKIGMELHDNIGALLTIIKFDLDLSGR